MRFERTYCERLFEGEAMEECRFSGVDFLMLKADLIT